MKPLKIYELKRGLNVIIYDGHNYIEDFIINGTANVKKLSMWVTFKNAGTMFSLGDMLVYGDNPKTRTKLLIQNIKIHKG